MPSSRAGTPTCVYRVDPELIELLDACLGPPLDSYVRGWQVWLEPNGPGGATLEWRLHPPARFRMPSGVDPHDLFDDVLQALADADDPAGDALTTGRERRTLGQIWEALEVFPAFGDPVGPGELVDAVSGVLRGRRPDAAGLVDHDRLGDLWKGRRGDFSVGRLLLERLDPVPP
ncbi:MAG: hypothetical protein M3N52_01935 [Actinomycetota bacterium]|nr:hypothetical protein [Actinomycetota bacterium]